MASSRDQVLKYVKRVLAAKDRMPTVAELQAFLHKAPRLSAAVKGKLVADYTKSSTTIERIARLDMKHVPRVRRQGRAI